jgi:hypothetical protein
MNPVESKILHDVKQKQLVNNTYFHYISEVVVSYIRGTVRPVARLRLLGIPGVIFRDAFLARDSDKRPSRLFSTSCLSDAQHHGAPKGFRLTV